MDAIDFARMFFALIAVLAMIGLAALAARKFGLAASGGVLVRKRRLNVVETLAIDARRRAVILSCDGREHLVILGANSETVVAGETEAARVEPTRATLTSASPALVSGSPASTPKIWRDAISAEAA